MKTFERNASGRFPSIQSPRSAQSNAFWLATVGVLSTFTAATAFSGKDGPAAYPKVGPPRAPQAALREFRIENGLRVELAACEPQVQSPVAAIFDERGRLWVVEMLDYPNGPRKGNPPEGRIKILEDKDGDGFYETATVFADKLLYANGLLRWRSGVIVTAAPHVVYLEDTDGDNVADKQTVLFDGFAVGNPQLRVSHPVLGPDNWVYVANGLRGGKIRPAQNQNAKPIDLSGRDFRFDPVTLGGEAVSGMGQFGNTFDDWGNRFVCDNRHHLRHVVLEERYLRNNPYFSAPAVLEDISETERDSRDGAGAPVFPLSAAWTTSNLHAGHFTAACGVYIYRETLLPAELRGAAFTCEPTGNLVHMEVLKPQGATFRSKPARDKVEFLASPDEWFRPVFLTGGWDGGLYIVDMYRAVIEHPEWMPPELRNRPDMLLGKDKGRIWRIVPDTPGPVRKRPNFSSAKTTDLVGALDNPSAWQRTTAQRLLLERPIADRPVESLNNLLVTAKNPQTLPLAARLLDGWGMLGAEHVARLLAHPNPGVRRDALRLAESRLGSSNEVLQAALQCANDNDAQVRFQAALSLGYIKGDSKIGALARIGTRDADDPWARAAIAASSADCVEALVIYLLGDGKSTNQGKRALIGELTTVVGAKADARELRRLLASAFDEKAAGGRAERVAVVSGLAAGLGRRGKSLGTMVAGFPAAAPEMKAIKDFFATALATASATAANADDRRQAIALLAHSDDPGVVDPLVDLVNNEPIPELRLAALRALGARSAPKLVDRLLEGWKTQSPAVRREIAESILRQPGHATQLLDAVEHGAIAANDLEPDTIRRLIAIRDQAISMRAKRLLAAALPGDRQKVYEQYRDCLKLPADAGRGREVFRKNCATCHQIAGIGVRVGPDVSDTRTKTPEMLLRDIVDPSAAIDANYVAYQIVTTSGKVLTGMIASETASSVSLRRAENLTDVVLRQDIEQIRSSGKSLMPDGLEKTIGLADMADLVAFLKNWRYLNGAPIAK